MISQIIKFIRVIGSEAEPIQISLGFALAMIAGFTPLLSVHNILVIFCLLIFRVNIASFLIALPIFSLLSYAFDPLFHQLGLSILENQSLVNAWTDMYNSGFWRLTHFNNSIVMGSLLASLALFIPMILVSNILVKRYRKHVTDAFKESRLFKFLQNNKMFSRFVSIAE